MCLFLANSLIYSCYSVLFDHLTDDLPPCSTWVPLLPFVPPFITLTLPPIHLFPFYSIPPQNPHPFFSCLSHIQLYRLICWSCFKCKARIYNNVTVLIRFSLGRIQTWQSSRPVVIENQSCEMYTFSASTVPIHAALPQTNQTLWENLFTPLPVVVLQQKPQRDFLLHEI